MPNCSQATCEGNNVITLQPRPCPQVQKPTCANGYPALKVADQDGCCLQYQCQCEPGSLPGGWGLGLDTRKEFPRVGSAWVMPASTRSVQCRGVQAPGLCLVGEGPGLQPQLRPPPAPPEQFCEGW